MERHRKISFSLRGTKKKNNVIIAQIQNRECIKIRYMLESTVLLTHRGCGRDQSGIRNDSKFLKKWEGKQRSLNINFPTKDVEKMRICAEKENRTGQLPYLHFRSQENTRRRHEHWIYTFQRVPATQQTARHLYR